VDIQDHIKEKLNRLYSDRFLGPEEISVLEKWLRQMESDPQVEQWLSANWEQAGNVELDISFEEIRQRIKKHGVRAKAERIRSISLWIQRSAAVLALPLLLLSVWLLINRQPAAENMALVTAKGERTHVWLPDGSEVWLNVDSRLEYSTAYHMTNRSLKLTGEAFFKVARGREFPFIVNAGEFRVKAIGTEFNVSAYDNEPLASACLKEGIVELSYAPAGETEQELRMKPGEKATINLHGKTIKLDRSFSSNALRWTDGELFIDDEPMDEVFRKIERWYDVKIAYNPSDFAGEALTVNLQNGEPVNHLFRIIDEAIGINIKQTADGYIIKRK